jgi:hypothetical protein
MKELAIAIGKTFIIVVAVAIATSIGVFIFSLGIGDDGYLTTLGSIITFLLIFIPAETLLYHAFIHSVNDEFHRYCFWCQLSKALNSLIDYEGDE